MLYEHADFVFSSLLQLYDHMGMMRQKKPPVTGCDLY